MKTLVSHRTAVTVLTGILFFFLAIIVGFALEIRSVMERTERSAQERALIEEQLQAEPTTEREATLVFVGDIMLSRLVGQKTQASGDYRYPFFQSAGFLQAADLVFGNLENPISDKGKNMGSIYSFRADPRVIEGLTFAGFDVLSLANNHIWDWGEAALVDTVSLLEGAGIESIGAGRSYEEANAPVFLDVGGVEIAFLAYTDLLPERFEAVGEKPGLSNFDLEKTVGLIESLVREDRLIVISFHWGDEYEDMANDRQRATAKALIDAGADLVVGHHPHVVQELEAYGDGWVAYSLGNFVFDQTFSEETMAGAVLKVKLLKGAVVEAELVPFTILPTLQPHLEESLLQ